jgi:sensor histidine kinase YesM
MNNDLTITGIVAEDEKKRTKKFWFYAFGIYSIVELVYIIINYIITRSICRHCVLPVPFYVSQWITHLLFTGILWYCLDLFYHHHRWKIVVANVFVFIAYYFLWLVVLYAILHSGQDWLLGKKTTILPFQSLVYGSWFDIGKYVLKLTAFYVLKFYFEYRKSERQRIQLAVINKDMQLNLLKQQLSPHFYFNTLNNLYGLARSNSFRLSDALHQLSNIMKYVIVDCNQPKVLLEQEVKFLQSYIALEKLRYEQNTVIEMRTEGDVNGQTILPLLLIQFVENAFKHGMKEKSDQNWMKVYMGIQKDELLFKVDNSYYESAVSEGIGINSVKHILNLQYEGKYDMQMLHKDNRFSVTLKLDLS